MPSGSILNLGLSRGTTRKTPQRRKRLWEEVKPKLAGLEKHPLSDEFVPYYRLTPGACGTLADVIGGLVRHKRGKVATVQWVETLDGAAAAAAEWFVWDPRTYMDIDGREDGITRVKADRVKGRQPVRGYSHNVFVSDAARDAMAAEKLGGYDTYWCADVGKYRATQWHHLVPTAFAGRGVDHPWFDPATRGRFKRDGFAVVQPTRDPWKRGANLFEFRQLRADPPGAGKEMKALLGLLRDSPAIRYEADINYVDGSVRLLREHLPEADVAFIWQAQPADEAGGDPVSSSRACVSRRAREFLLKKKLATAADFQPLAVLDKPSKGAAVFDGPPAPPIYGSDFARSMRTLEAKLLAKHRAKPKPEAPVKPVPLKPLLAKLKREVKGRGGDVPAGAKPAEVAAAGKAAGIPVPARWGEIMAAMDGFLLDECAVFDGGGELRASRSAALPAEHRSSARMIRAGWSAMPRGYLAVGGNDVGDPLFLDTAKTTRDGDCPVVWIDHETTQAVQTWPSISLFLKDALEPSEE